MKYLLLLPILFLIALIFPYRFFYIRSDALDEQRLENPQIEAQPAVYKTITAYNAEVGQTDSSPLITASGKKVKEGYVAYNCAEFGTEIIINNQIYEVQDRMHKRWGCERMDIFMKDKTEALTFGKQILPVIIK